MKYQKPKVGSKIRVTVKNPFHNVMVCFYPSTSEYIGTVLPSDEWMSDLEFNLSGDKNFPVRGIALQSVIDIKPFNEGGEVNFTTVSATKMQKFSIKSSKGDKTYVVTVDEGRWSCNCVAGMYRKKSQCRHIEEAQSLDNG
jgi:hypothetical protein